MKILMNKLLKVNWVWIKIIFYKVEFNLAKNKAS